MYMGEDTCNLLIKAKNISKRNGFGYIPKIILFGTLALEDSPLHTYLINKGLDNIKIAKQVKRLYNKYFKEEKERLELFENSKEMIREIQLKGKNKNIEDFDPAEDYKYIFQSIKIGISDMDQENVELFVVTTETSKIIIIAADIAKNMFESSEITNSHMLASIYKFMPDICEEFIKSCLDTETFNA